MNSRRLYVSHHPSRSDGNGMKLFHFSSVLGKFKASLVSSAYIPSPYPYLQDHLYNVSQPGNYSVVFYNISRWYNEIKIMYYI